MGAYGDRDDGQDTGRKCYREPGELRQGPEDNRPRIDYREFWRSPQEASAYLSAVRDHPRVVDVERDEIESPLAYIQRIAAIVEARLAPVRTVPPPNKALPVQTPEPPYEERLEALFTPRQPGEEG